MSDPIDARVLRQMVREAAGESHPEIDWDAAEARLLAQLDEPPSALGRVLIDSASEKADASEEERVSDHSFADTPIREAVLHTPDISRLALVDDASDATDSQHSPSLIHEPPNELAGKRPIRSKRAQSLPRARWAALAALAVAACALFFLSTHHGSNANGPTETITAERWVDPDTVAMAPGLDNVRDLGALRPGDVVEATQGAVSFGTKDKLTWTLSPGTRVLVRSGLDEASMRHVLVLQNGSIRAEVLKPAGPFVVEAGDTNVASDSWDPDTNRTIFSVTRSSIGLVIDVEAGATTVGSRIDGSTNLRRERRVAAPLRAAASLDGATSFKLLDPIRAAMRQNTPIHLDSPRPEVIAPAPAPEPTHEVTPAAEPPRPQAPETPATPAEPPAAQRPMDGVLTESAISSMLFGCFADAQAKRKATEKDPDLAVSVHSTLSLVVDGDSTIHGAAFNPPLRPDLQSCAVGLLHKKVTGGARTITVPIDLSH